nr:protein kinase [Verrucomicrobiota bacterium]
VLPLDPITTPPLDELASSDGLLAEVLVFAQETLLAKYAIEHGEYLIGRDASCQIVVDADEVSRHHARLTFSAFELVIEDLGSSNGVFIGGVQVQIPTRVRPEQEVQIGGARIFIRLRDSAQQQLTEALWGKELGLGPVRKMLDGAKYKAITTLARGGMGVVLQARDLRIRRAVAMKVMKTGHQFSPEHVLRFIDEAQLTGQLDHPNIVPVYELGIDDQSEIFYTMKYVKGITLDDVLRGLRHGRAETLEKYPLAALLTIFQKICDAVAFAHAKGVVHRDLKPENIMIGPYGEVLVMDWGLAKNLTGSSSGEGERSTPVREPTLAGTRGFQTMNGLIIGTPPFISPEQARGDLEKIDARSDIYVLGAMLYAILTLRAPFGGTTVAEVLNQILESRFEPATSFNQPPKSGGKRSSAGQEEGKEEEEEETIELAHLPAKRVPEGLSAVVMKAMHANPGARYQSVEEMQADVAAYQAGFAPKAERAGVFKQAFLWAGRHKGEVGLALAGFLFICVMVATFIYRLAGEKNRALASEQRAVESEKLSERRLLELRGTAPVFAEEAKSLLEDERFDEALDKINYAIAQVPNSAEYRYIRGNALQALLRFDEAVSAYEEALVHNPNHKGAKENLALTKKIIAGIGLDGRIPPALLRELQEDLMRQSRIGEALGVLDHIGEDKDLFYRTWREALHSRGLPQRLEATDDETLNIDLSRVALPDLRKLRDFPVTGLNLSDTRIPDISALKGLQLQSLSLGRTFVRDLSPLIGMPLKTLRLDATPASDLRPLAGMPLERLHMNNTRVTSLEALRGCKLEELYLGGCRGIKDLSPLEKMPLQRMDLSRTAVSDLRPLTASPLRELNLDGCIDLVDLTPLMEIKTLETVLIPKQCKDIAFLRAHPSIKRLSYKKTTQPAYEFWEQFDSAGASGKP